MLAQLQPTQNDILHNLFENFIDAMSPLLNAPKNEKLNNWPNFHSLLKEKPLNYYNIQSFLSTLESDPKQKQEQQSQQQPQKQQQQQSQPQQLHQVNSSKSIEQQKYYIKKELSTTNNRSHRNTTYSKITPLSPRLQFHQQFEDFSKIYLQQPFLASNYPASFNFDQQVFAIIDQQFDSQSQQQPTENLFRLISFEYFYSLLREDPQQFQETLVTITTQQVKLLLPILTQTNLIMTEEHFYQSLIDGCSTIFRDSDQPKQIIQPLEFFRLFQNDAQFCDCIVFIIKDIVYKHALQQFTQGNNSNSQDQEDLQQLLDYFTENCPLNITLNHIDLISCALQRKIEVNELNRLTGKIQVLSFPLKNKQKFFSSNKTAHQRSLSVFGNSSQRDNNKQQIAIMLIIEEDSNNNNNNNNWNIIDLALQIQKTEFALMQQQNEDTGSTNSKQINRQKYRSYEKSKTHMFQQLTAQDKSQQRILLSSKHNQYQKDISKRILTEENSFNENACSYQQMQSQREGKRESVNSKNVSCNLQKSQNQNIVFLKYQQIQLYFQKIEQPVPQILVKKTTEILDFLTSNNDKLTSLLTPKPSTPISYAKLQTTPKPIHQQQTYFQNFSQQQQSAQSQQSQHSTYQVYNSRPSSQFQAQMYPASVYQQPSMHFQQQSQQQQQQQQSCHSQQHSFQYFSQQQQMVKNQPITNNGFVQNNKFY